MTDERTERIVYGDMEWMATPRQKAAWESFWRKVIAQARRNCGNPSTATEDLGQTKIETTEECDDSNKPA